MSDEKSWSVIKFPNEEDAVAVVPTSWMRNNQCYWPPWNQDRIESAIKSCRTPDYDTWQTHPFVPMRNNVFNDFQAARKKMHMATEKSDLESQHESQDEIFRNSKGRKLIKTSLTRYTSFEFSEDDSHETCTLPTPPKLKAMTKKKKGLAHSSNKENICEDQDENCLYNSKKILSHVPHSDAKEFTESHIEGDLTNKRNREEDVLEDNRNQKVSDSRKKIHLENPAQVVINDESRSGCGSQVVTNQTELNSNLIFEYLKKILRKQNIIQSAIADLAEDVIEIKNKLGENVANNIVENQDSIFTTLNLPVNSDEELKALEAHLETDLAVTTSVKEIACCGGRTVYDFVFRATQKLITNKYAAQYSYLGRQKKLKFSSLKLNEILIKAPIKSFSCIERDAEGAISKWLRRCTERSKKENV